MTGKCGNIAGINGNGGNLGNIPLSVYGNSANGHLSPGQGSDVFSSYNGHTGTLPSFKHQHPPAPPALNGGSMTGSLNISNPRYSAMYRNTLLRYSPTEPLPPPTPVYPGHAPVPGPSLLSPMSVRSGGNMANIGNISSSSPYHTMRPHIQQSQQQQQYIQVGEYYISRKQ